MELAAGASISPTIRLVRKLGAGATSAVWLAEQHTLRIDVAVKIMTDHQLADADAVRRFRDQAHAAARVRSPHVVQIIDAGASSGMPYVVMELLEGEDLRARLARSGRLSVPETRRVARQAGLALEKAHAAGVIHRDIKPANLFLLDVGGETFVKVTDFGIAKLLRPPHPPITASTAIFGTPHYMSPEQAVSSRDVGPASDLWSLGVVVYQCLTGTLPFDARTLLDLYGLIEEARFPEATSVNPALPAGVDAWFSRALALRPEDRFSSALAMLKALDRAIDSSTASSVPPASTSLGRRARSEAVTAAMAPSAAQRAAVGETSAGVVVEPGVALPKRFRFVRKLGAGGMGIVYEVIDEELGAKVALKTIRTASADALGRFKREFRSVADVHHPNLVRLGELISEGSQWFFTMELVEGEDFISYVRPPNADAGGARTLDVARLRAALPQLAAAADALHRAGVVHRDLKPSNIRVSPAGRVVVLDFGLAADLSAAPFSVRGTVSGTPEYMSPEQATAGPVGPPADWYAFGVVLFEALTGELPFSGSALDVVMKRRRRPAPPARSGVVGLEDLEALCRALLEQDAEARPTGETVLAMLTPSGGGERVAPGPRRSSNDAAVFVGRAAELRALHEAYAASFSERPISVLVDGESGVGKSCLARRFVTALSAEDPDVVVFAGRCYEREALPYRAFDGVMDALASFLARQPDAVAARVVPARPAPLLQVFPVLRRASAFARAASAPMPAVDPVEIRGRAFAALREMFMRLAGERRPVVVIDDLQWADADSLLLLAEMMAVPAPPLLLLATVRAQPDDAAAVARLAARFPGEVRRVTLGRLSGPEARELATRLLGDDGTSTRRAESIARETGGHPLFIDILSHHAAVSGGAESSRLDQALFARVEALDPMARGVLQMLAVSSAPLTHHVLLGASDASPESFMRCVSLLRASHLVSTAGARTFDEIEPYHDRVRAAVLAQMSESEQAVQHRALATALERSPAPANEALSFHWEGAHEPARASMYAARAGDDARAALAFDRAAALYERALVLGGHPSEERTALYEKLGDSLANAGRGARAAEAYRRAASASAPDAALDLNRRAADQLLRAGHIDEGVVAVRAVLEATGIPFPRTPLGALLVFILLRIWLRIRGAGYTRTPESAVPKDVLRRIDTCCAVANGLSMVDSVRGAAFQARHVLLALRAGEPYRVALALGSEVGYFARAGGRAWTRTFALNIRAIALAEESKNPQAIGWTLAVSGLARYINGRYKPALAFEDQALEVLESRCTGVGFEMTFAKSFALWALAQLGELRELRRRQPVYLKIARERGDLWGVVNLCAGDGALGWLADDEPERVHEETTAAMSRWSQQGVQVEHFFEVIGRTHADLYAGRAEEAYTRVAARWRALQRSLIPATVQSIRIQSLHFRARSALAFAAASPDGARLVARAEADARAIERERTPWATPMAKMLLAGAAASRRGVGDDLVAGLLREAAAGFDVADMALYAAVARKRLGAVLGGDEGRELTRLSDAWFEREGVKRPDRMTEMLAPGFEKGGA